MSDLKELPDMVVAASAGLNHIKYLTETWMPVSLWSGWSKKGHIEASIRLNIPVDGVIPTTNHLEAFNGILKRKHIHRWQRAGKRLRFDLFVYLLATQILPGIFAHRSMQEQYYSWLSNRFSAKAGGIDLVAVQRKPMPARAPVAPIVPVAWWYPEADEPRVNEAKYMISRSCVAEVAWWDEFTAIGTCAASSANIRVPGHKRYNLRLNVYGWSCCSCLGFSNNHGACKHLWALRLSIPALIDAGSLPPSRYAFHYPATENEAREVYRKCFGMCQVNHRSILYSLVVVNIVIDYRHTPSLTRGPQR